MATERLERCLVTVTNGHAIAVYRWEIYDVDGVDSLDDDVSSWTDDEIIEGVAAQIGIEDDDDLAKVEIVWD